MRLQTASRMWRSEARESAGFAPPDPGIVQTHKKSLDGARKKATLKVKGSDA